VLAYDSRGVHIELDQSGKTCAITLFQPCRISLNGIELLGRSLSDVKRDLDLAGLPFEKVDTGLWSDALLVMIVEQDGTVDGVEARRIPY